MPDEPVHDEHMLPTVISNAQYEALVARAMMREAALRRNVPPPDPAITAGIWHACNPASFSGAATVARIHRPNP